MEAVGSTCAVMGKSMATVTAGPRPGSTPMAVPRAQPTKAHIKLMGVPAVTKPASKLFQVSNMMCFRGLEPRRAGQIGQVDGQEQSEEPKHGCRN